MLKLSFANDSNSLQPKFYSELLHLIGLAEVKEGSKKLIQRKKEGLRDPGSLLENTIIQLESHDKLSRLDKPSQYGETKEERLYAVALELVITWVNRILFLKLLEAQLISYHRGDRSYTFLNRDKIKDFDDLDKLFFRVLAKLPEERSDDIQKLFGRVPYLNSSLFEPTELEHQTLFINGLEDFVQLPLISSTVWKDSNGKSLKGSLITLDYLFGFLDAYDFSSEGAEDIQEDNKTLINASVLGLIFEKINGYKDGSFFTPGFITMYMCRETIRRAVVQKFNEAKGWECKELNDLYNKIEDNKEANAIINSLKICDPAVGSGHFLVSALNEIIAIKADLNILLDREGRRLKEYQVEVVNDELSITDEEGNPFSYNPNSKESQRVQEALFHEKQSIIENCLFGVDINPNSVKICRLRLWIELLKNAYYKTHPTLSQGEGFSEGAPLSFGERPGHLETLPNIDINIKTGNSLISRFALDADLKKALKKSKFGANGIDSYRFAVKTYQNARSKEEKREMEQLILAIKSDFRTEIANYDPRKIRRAKILADHYLLTGKVKGGFGMMLFEDTADYSSKNAKLIKERAEKLLNEVAKIDASLEEDEKNIIYENAFEWRFEFPQVLNDEGDFVGFDVVIGNPPYGVQFSPSLKAFISNNYQALDDIYTLFLEKGLKLSKSNGHVSLIIPIFWLTGDKYYSTRKFLKENANLEVGISLPYNIFSDAYVDTGIYIFIKDKQFQNSMVYEFDPKEIVNYNVLNSLKFTSVLKNEWTLRDDLKIILNEGSRSLSDKVNSFNQKIGSATISVRGILANKGDYSEFLDSNSDDFKPVFVGRIDRYLIESGKSTYVKYGDNLKEKPSSSDYFTGERLLVRRIINRKFRIMATITNESFITKKDIYIFKSIDNKFSHKFLLAIINSKLMSFIKTKGSASAKKDDFTQLTLTDIRGIGIPVPTEEQTKRINILVDALLDKKILNTELSFDIEKELDQLVYQLYGLTEEEIKIVED